MTIDHQALLSLMISMLHTLFFYLLCLFHFYKNTKIQNTFTNIILHKKIYEIKRKNIYIYKITNFLKRI